MLGPGLLLGCVCLALPLDIRVDERLCFGFVPEVIGLVLEVDELIRAFVGGKLAVGGHSEYNFIHLI